MGLLWADILKPQSLLCWGPGSWACFSSSSLPSGSWTALCQGHYSHDFLWPSHPDWALLVSNMKPHIASLLIYSFVPWKGKLLRVHSRSLLDCSLCCHFNTYWSGWRSLWGWGPASVRQLFHASRGPDLFVPHGQVACSRQPLWPSPLSALLNSHIQGLHQVIFHPDYAFNGPQLLSHLKGKPLFLFKEPSSEEPVFLQQCNVQGQWLELAGRQRNLGISMNGCFVAVEVSDQLDWSR